MFKISNLKIADFLGAPTPEFPKYATQVLNLANSNAQGTRPRIVGQMSDLMQQFSGTTMEEWLSWYQQRYPHALEDATTKVFAMVENLSKVIGQIDRTMVKEWVEDLVLYKTFCGFRFQAAIMKAIAERENLSHRPATPEEESKGIDGYIGEKAVSIKPVTYKSRSMTLSENITVRIIYYEKQKDGIRVDYDFG
jgi:hypothetical protein